MTFFYWENKIPFSRTFPECSLLFLKKVLHYQKGKYYIILYDILLLGK